MFWKLIFWPLKVNTALAGIGINPTSIVGQTRTDIQLLGLDAGLTPQETALVLVSLLAGIHSPIELELIVSVWHHDKKVNFEKPEVIDVLDEIGCPVGDPRWWSDAIDISNGTLDDERLEEVDEYAKSPIAQLFAKVRHKKLLAAMGKVAVSKTLP